MRASTKDIFTNLTLSAELDESGDIQFVIDGLEKSTRTFSPEISLSSNSNGAKTSGGIHFLDQHYRGMGELLEVTASQNDDDESILFSAVPNIQIQWSECGIGKNTVLSFGYDQTQNNHRLKQLYLDELMLSPVGASRPSPISTSSWPIDYKQLNTLSKKLYTSIVKANENSRLSVEPYLSQDNIGFKYKYINMDSRFTDARYTDNNNKHFQILQSGVKFIYDYFPTTARRRKNNKDSVATGNDDGVSDSTSASDDNKYNLQLMYDGGSSMSSRHSKLPYNQLQATVDDYDSRGSVLVRLGRPLLPALASLSNKIVNAAVTVSQPFVSANHAVSVALFRSRTKDSPNSSSSSSSSGSVSSNKTMSTVPTLLSSVVVTPAAGTNLSARTAAEPSQGELCVHNQKKVKM